MSLVDALRIAMRAIIANRMRSALTSLGLVIGVSSVIVLIAVGQGAQQGVIEQIRGLGADLIFVQPGVSENAQTGARGPGGSALTLTASDADAIAELGIPSVSGVVSQIDIPAQAIAGSNNQGVGVVGTTAEYPRVRGLEVADGSLICS